MPKYKAKIKNSKLIVKVKLFQGELPVERELSMVSQRAFRGLLKPTVIKSNRLEYSGPQGSSLSDYLKQPLTGYEFHFILAQIVRLEKKLTNAGLAIKHLIMDPHYIYINPYTKELQFIYLPLLTDALHASVCELMEMIICRWRPAPEADMQYPARFLSLLRSQQSYLPDRILDYIQRYDARVAEQLRRTQTSMSGFIANKQADYYSHYGTLGKPQKDILSSRAPATDVLHGASALGGTQPISEETGLLAEEQLSDTALLEMPCSDAPNSGNSAFLSQAQTAPQWEEETDLLDEPLLPQWDEETGLPDTELFPQQGEETGLPDTEPFPQQGEETGLPDTELFPQQGEETGLPDTELFPQQEETGLLEESIWGDTELFEEAPTDPCEEETGLFSDLRVSPAPSYPYLIRRSMNERISVNKPVFRIGKERSYVDCFISNNGAISRSHADIIRRGNRFFLCDRNSTNKTYRNGYLLTPEDEVEIFDGDVLQLANEEFEFHIH